MRLTVASPILEAESRSSARDLTLPQVQVIGNNFPHMLRADRVRVSCVFDSRFSKLTPIRLASYGVTGGDDYNTLTLERKVGQ